MLKKCPRCGRVLPAKEFVKDDNMCRICRRDYNWQYKYGISPEQYLQMYQEQGGKCKICGKELPDGEYLHIDHNKDTGEVRGLLCGKCNRGLGIFDELPENFIKAVEYLKEHNND